MARIEQDRVDALILDLGLPDCDGLEVLGELRDRGQAVPVIVITARSNPEDRTIALARGASEFFRKPFPLADIRSALQRRVAHTVGPAWYHRWVRAKGGKRREARTGTMACTHSRA